jgi:hypothetical protein
MLITIGGFRAGEGDDKPWPVAPNTGVVAVAANLMDLAGEEAPAMSVDIVWGLGFSRRE